MAYSGSFSGVYQIKCLPTGKAYVGSAVDVKGRWKEHRLLLAKNQHHSPLLQRSWNKYGNSAFAWKVLKKAPIAKLLIVEQTYIDKLFATGKQLNINPVAGSSLGTKHSRETRDKISESHRYSVDSKTKREIVRLLAKQKHKLYEIAKLTGTSPDTVRRLSKEHGAVVYWKRRLSQRTVDAVVLDLRRRENDYRQLSIKHGVSRDTVGKIAKAHGVAHGKGTQLRTKVSPAVRRSIILCRKKEHLSYSKLAQRFSVSQATAWNVVNGVT